MCQLCPHYVNSVQRRSQSVGVTTSKAQSPFVCSLVLGTVNIPGQWTSEFYLCYRSLEAIVAWCLTMQGPKCDYNDLGLNSQLYGQPV